MNNLSTEDKQFQPETTVEQFNDEPVFYCKHCLSLAIRTSHGIDYCDKCGGTEIEMAHICDWEKMYKQKYGENYLIENKNGRKD